MSVSFPCSLSVCVCVCVYVCVCVSVCLSLPMCVYLYEELDGSFASYYIRELCIALTPLLANIYHAPYPSPLPPPHSSSL